MNWWAYARQFPKYALVMGIIVGSTAVFISWWLFFRIHPKTPTQLRDDTADRATIARNAAKAAERVDYLFLADDDLYDAGTGELLLKNWLHGDHPVRLFYDVKTKKILGQYAEGFVRYNFEGLHDAVMMLDYPSAFAPGLKHVVFAKAKNIWAAEIDWETFKFVNERQVTTMGVFYEQHFAENVVLLTDKTLVVRNMNDLLRVTLEDGKVKPGRLRVKDITSQRSPDSRWMVGTDSGQFYCYDVDTDTAKTIPVRRNSVNRFLWLGNDKCLGLAGNAVVTYDRPGHALTEVCALPFSCFKIGEPSPDGQFVFCAGGINGQNGVLVDLERKTAAPVKGGAGITWVSNDTFAFSRDMADSNFRGTWLQTAGIDESRVSPEPFLMSKTGPQLLQMPTAGLTIIETRYGLLKMNSENGSVGKFAELSHLPTRLLGISNWKVN